MDDSATGIRQMRPMGAAELIDATVTLYRNNFALFAGVVAVLAVPQTILNMIFVSLLPTATTLTATSSTTTFDTAAQNYSVVAARGTGSGIIGAVFAILIMGALTQVVAARYLGRPETIPGAYTDTGVGPFVRLFLMLLLGIVAFIALVAFAVILVVLAVTLGGGSVPLVLSAVLLAIVVFVLAVYAVPHLYLVPQVIVLERRGVFGSIGRSWFLTRGWYWHVVGVVTLVELMVFVLSIIIAGVVALATVGNPVLGAGVNGVLGIILQPVSLGVLTLLYFDQRVRKEGFDLEYAAEHMALSSR